MRSHLRTAAAIALLGALAVASCSSSDDDASGSKGTPTSAPAAKPPAYATELQSEIPQVMDENAIPGAVVLIRSRDQGNWSSAFGTKTIDGDEPISLDDYFRIGSNTKTMTATVILQLVQEGKVSLDDPLSKYVAGFPNGEQITIGEVAAMRSGLDAYTSVLSYNQTLDDDPTKAWAPEELLDLARPLAPLFPPGEQYNYSNTNYALLGVIIEQLTGKSVAENFEERIFEPLGLDQTSYPARTDSSIPDPHPQGYQFRTNVEDIDSYAVPPEELPAALDGTLPPLDDTIINPSAFFTAGAVISTPRDMADYVEGMVGGKLLDERTQELRIASIQQIDPAKPTGYGYGLVEFRPFLYGHDGQVPGFGTFLAYDIDADITIVVATNLAASPVDGENAAVVLYKAIAAALYDSPFPNGEPNTTGRH
jgi:D-alanyl-D-alanine carboxypeptidase